jgi:hypothetical protein
VSFSSLVKASCLISPFSFSLFYSRSPTPLANFCPFRPKVLLALFNRVEAGMKEEERQKKSSWMPSFIQPFRLSSSICPTLPAFGRFCSSSSPLIPHTTTLAIRSTAQTASSKTKIFFQFFNHLETEGRGRRRFVLVATAT